MDHTLYKSPGYTPLKNYFRSWIFAEVELFCYYLNCGYYTVSVSFAVYRVLLCVTEEYT